MVSFLGEGTKCRRCLHEAMFHVHYGQLIDCGVRLCDCKHFIPRNIQKGDFHGDKYKR
jgi:hypothetical protein